MRPERILQGLTTSLIAATLVLAGCATAGSAGITDATLAERVAQAHTSADHERLAVYFDQRAAAAERKREELRRWRRGYERMPQSVFYPIGTASRMLEHYDELIEGRQRDAESYRALADWHRRLGAAQRSATE